jgi:hypothetical protein
VLRGRINLRAKGIVGPEEVPAREAGESVVATDGPNPDKSRNLDARFIL